MITLGPATHFKFCEITTVSNQALLKFLFVCVQIDLLLNPCAYEINASGHFGGILQLIKFSKTSKLIKIARIVKVIRLGKVFKLLKKIEERFVMVRLTAFKAMSILGATFIIAHLFGCMFIFFATLDNDEYYSNSWISNKGQFTQHW